MERLPRAVSGWLLRGFGRGSSLPKAGEPHGTAPAAPAADKAPENKAVANNAAADRTATGSPTNPALASTGPSPADIAKSVQTELRRVGCFTGAVDGEWNAASQRSLALFNRSAGTKLDVKLASVDALDAIKLKPSRVCPLICEHGFKADGDRCSKIVCAEGSFLNDDNECEKRRAQDADRKARNAGSKASSARTASFCQAFSNTDCKAVVSRPAAHRPGTRGGLQLIPGHHVGKVPITKAARHRTRRGSSSSPSQRQGSGSPIQGRDGEDGFRPLR